MLQQSDLVNSSLSSDSIYEFVFAITGGSAQIDVYTIHAGQDILSNGFPFMRLHCHSPLKHEIGVGEHLILAKLSGPSSAGQTHTSHVPVDTLDLIPSFKLYFCGTL